MKGDWTTTYRIGVSGHWPRYRLSSSDPVPSLILFKSTTVVHGEDCARVIGSIVSFHLLEQPLIHYVRMILDRRAKKPQRQLTRNLRLLHPN